MYHSAVLWFRESPKHLNTFQASNFFKFLGVECKKSCYEKNCSILSFYHNGDDDCL